MLRADSAAYAREITALRDDIALPLPAAAQGARFGALLGSVRDEVEAFIADGSQDDGGLTAAGQVWRARLQAAEQERVEHAEPVRVSGLSRARPTAVYGEGLEDGQRDFLARIAPWAEGAGRRLGVAPALIAAQAALESGWGERPLRDASGADTHNLFGLKAGSGWRGEVVETLTTEYEDGAAVKRSERFRRYADPAGAFRDFTRLLLDNPRYAEALNTGGDASAYARGLVRGGYATDPAYADKLVRLATRIQRAD